MSNENQAAEENQNPEGQTKPETASEVNAEVEAEMIAKSKARIPFFNEAESVETKGGEIDLLVNALYEACKAKNIPFIGAINYAVIDDGDSFSVGLRGIQVIGENGFAPANLNAMQVCMQSKEVSELVLNIAQDETKMKMLSLMSQMG